MNTTACTRRSRNSRILAPNLCVGVAGLSAKLSAFRVFDIILRRLRLDGLDVTKDDNACQHQWLGREYES
jgi:hypothetical protein